MRRALADAFDDNSEPLRNRLAECPSLDVERADHRWFAARLFLVAHGVLRLAFHDEYQRLALHSHLPKRMGPRIQPIMAIFSIVPSRETETRMDLHSARWVS